MLEELKDIKIKISENLLLGIIPILGYVAAFSYESSYLSYFGISQEFVYLDVKSVVYAILGVATLLLILVILLEVISPYYLKFDKENSLHRRIALFIIISLLFLVIALLMNIIFVVIILFVFECFLFSLFFVYPLIKYRKLNLSYKEKISKSEKIKTTVVRNATLFDYIFKHKGVRPLIVLVVSSGVILIISSISGRMEATIKTHYMSFAESDREYLVIRSYSDKILAVEVDPSHKLLINNFKFVNIERNISFKLVRTGKVDNIEVRQ